MRFVICLILIVLPVLGSAQIIPSETAGDGPDATDPRVGSYYSVFPLAGYTSDWGFFGGAFVQRINYGVHVLPFLSNTKADFTASTKGTIISSLNYERTRTFGTSLRSRVVFIGRREKQGRYFGIGNNTRFENDLFRDDFYFYENRELYLNYEARKKISEFGRNTTLDVFGELSFWYVNGQSNSDETLFEEDQPFGYGNGWVNKAGIGLLADSRDSEFIPTRGFRYETGINFSTPVLGSDFTFAKAEADFRHYFMLFNQFVVAHNLRFEHIMGDTPFWALSIIGRENGLRGYHLNRFRGDSSVLSLLEIRTWLFSLFDGQIRLGGQVFWDTGRVFSEYDDNQFFNNWKQTIGAGGVMSIFNPDFFVRGDLGFSDETYRIYFGAGYIF